MDAAVLYRDKDMFYVDIIGDGDPREVELGLPYEAARRAFSAIAQYEKVMTELGLHDTDYVDFSTYADETGPYDFYEEPIFIDRVVIQKENTLESCN